MLGITTAEKIFNACYLARMDESAEASRILIAVPPSDWKRPTGRPHTLWLATMKNDGRTYHTCYTCYIIPAYPVGWHWIWRLLAASGATHCANRTMMAIITYKMTSSLMRFHTKQDVIPGPGFHPKFYGTPLTGGWLYATACRTIIIRLLFEPSTFQT